MPSPDVMFLQSCVVNQGGNLAGKISSHLVNSRCHIIKLIQDDL